MKIYDCFTFFNELELLDLRLMTLNDIVDKFILVESDKSHTGKPKEFIFDQHKDEFEKYLNKIIYIKVEDLPQYHIGDIWNAENFQRNCISRGLLNAQKEDIIIVSDIDEIPNPSKILSNLKVLSKETPLVFTQYLFYYYINCMQTQTWCGSTMCVFETYGSPQRLRDIARYHTTPSMDVSGGWHYSFMGGAERIKQKVENIAESHLIIDKIGDIKSIESKMITQADLWNRKDPYANKHIVDISIEGHAPYCIKDFIKKYPNFYFGEL